MTTGARIAQHTFFIGCDFVQPHGDERLDVINPATEEVTGGVPRAVAADMDTAVAARAPGIRPGSASRHAAALAALEWAGADVAGDCGPLGAGLAAVQPAEGAAAERAAQAAGGLRPAHADRPTRRGNGAVGSAGIARARSPGSPWMTSTGGAARTGKRTSSRHGGRSPHASGRASAVQAMRASSRGGVPRSSGPVSPRSGARLVPNLRVRCSSISRSRRPPWLRNSVFGTPLYAHCDRPGYPTSKPG